MEFSLIPAQHYPVTVMESPINGNTSLQISVSNLNASFSRPDEQEEEGKLSSDAIWLWVAIIATVCNIVVVAVRVRSLHIRTSGFS